jgi:cytochrome c-type biogenesis protein
LTGSDAGLVAAFLAGVVSFASPCILPLLPGYLAFLAASGAAGAVSPRPRLRLFLHGLLFVAGFSLVFIALGASASALGSLLRDYRTLLTRVAGVVVFAFGLLMLGVLRAPSLYREVRLDPARTTGLGGWTALAMGAAFGFGWTPCVGPVLGTILVLAGGSAPAQGVALLAAYSLGLGVPFLLAALLFDRVGRLSGWLERRSLVIQRVSGVVLMLLGLTMATGTLAPAVSALSRVLHIPVLG